jgi:hypothetical protein
LQQAGKGIVSYRFPFGLASGGFRAGEYLLSSNEKVNVIQFITFGPACCRQVGSSSFVTSSSIELGFFSALGYVKIIMARRIGSQLRKSYLSWQK